MRRPAIALLLASGTAWGQVPDLDTSRRAIQAYRQDGWVLMLARECGYITPDRARTIANDMSSRAEIMGDAAGALALQMFVDGSKMAEKELAADKEAACQQFRPKEDLDRVVQLRIGKSPLADDAWMARLPAPSAENRAEWERLRRSDATPVQQSSPAEPAAPGRSPPNPLPREAAARPMPSNVRPSSMDFAEATDHMRGVALTVAQAAICRADPRDLTQAMLGGLAETGWDKRDWGALMATYRREMSVQVPRQRPEDCDARLSALLRLGQKAP